jgi:hypothetical protein
MNDVALKIVTMRAAAALLVAGLLAGCASIDPVTASVDPDSPSAQRIEALIRENREYPTWRDFPAEPTNLPSPADYAARVAALQAAETELAGEVAALVWTLEDTDGFLAETRTLVNPAMARPVTAADVADTEAFLRRARELATPPPAVK